MRIVLSYDYEIFFGAQPGPVDRTLIEPTDRLAQCAHAHGVPLAFFVDAGYLLRLNEARSRHAAAEREYGLVGAQLERLFRGGHELQLHVHPHWEDSLHTGEALRIDMSRPYLRDFPTAEIHTIVDRYLTALCEFTPRDRVIAFRSGGWALEPFADLGAALQRHGVFIDSSVFRGGFDPPPRSAFDFRRAPAKTAWWFRDDPQCEDPEGAFLEIPISAFPVSPLYYWKLLCVRQFGGERFRAYGQGAVSGGHAAKRRDAIRKLLTRTVYCATTDGYKASLLESQYEQARADGAENFVVIGHPKTTTPYSIEMLDRFLRRVAGEGDDVVSYQAFNDPVSRPRRIVADAGARSVAVS